MNFRKTLLAVTILSSFNSVANVVIVDPIKAPIVLDPVDDVVITPIKAPINVTPIDVIIDPIKAPINVTPIDVVIDPIKAPIVLDPIDVIVDPIKKPIVLDPVDDVVLKPIKAPIVLDPIDVIVDPIKKPIVLDPVDDVVLKPIKAPIVLDPIDVIIDPIEEVIIIDPIEAAPIVIGNDEMIALTNKVLANQGEGTATLIQDKNGAVVLTWTDQVSGETRHMNMNDLDSKQLEIVKTEFASYMKGNSPIVDPIDVIIDPIENEPTVPTRGEWVAEKKAAIKEKFGNHVPSEPRHDNGNTAKERMAEYKEQIGGNLPTEPRHDDGQTAQEKMAAFKEEGAVKLAARIEEAKNNNQNDTTPVVPAPEFNFDDQYQDMITAELEQLDTKMDSVMASTHAINNARPFLSGAGKTSIGLGMGYAGEEGAVAVGIAHSFTESWSASMTINATTGTHSEVSSGAGVQFQF